MLPHVRLPPCVLTRYTPPTKNRVIHTHISQKKTNMTPIENYSTLRKFIMQYGTYNGAVWASLFLCNVYAIRLGNDYLSMASVVLLVFAAFYNFRSAANVKLTALALGIRVTPLRSFIYPFSMLMYTCLFTSAIEFLYFYKLDNGEFFGSIKAILNAPGVKETYSQLGVSGNYTEVTELLDIADGMTALDITGVLLNQHFFLSILLIMLLAPFTFYFRGTKYRNAEK